MNDTNGKMEGFGLGISKTFAWMPDSMMLPTDFVSRVNLRGHNRVYRLEIGKCFRRYKIDISHCVSLDVSYTDMTDEDIISNYNERMVSFNVSGCAVSDNVLHALRRTVRLKELLVSETNVTDRGLRSLHHIEGIEVVALDGTNVGDATIDILCGWENLKYISIGQTAVTPPEVPRLRFLRSLRILRCPGLRVNDGDLQLLSECPSLEILDISDSAVSDVGAIWLERFPKLRQVTLSEGRISQEVIEGLRRSLDVYIQR